MHSRRSDIRDLCPPHAHLSHGSANLSQGPSSINASLLGPPDGHRHFIPPDHTDSGQEISASAPYQVQTGVCPQSRPTFTQQTAVIRATQGRTAIAPAAVIPHHFLDAEMYFLREKKIPPTHHGQATQRPQFECITQMPLLIRAFVTAPPRFSVSTKPAQIAMITNGRSLSQLPPFELRRLPANDSSHFPSHPAPMMHRSHI